MSQNPTPSLHRRRLFAAGGTVTALAGVAAVLPLAQPAQPPQAKEPAAPEKGGGYRLSAHVQQYYDTARV